MNILKYKFKFLITICLSHLLLSNYGFAENLEQKIAKLLIIPVSPDHGQEHIEKVFNLLKSKGIGGIILMQAAHKEEVREFIKRIRKEIPYSVLVFQDSEWGAGMRLLDISPLPKNMTIGAIKDRDLLIAYGIEIARECREIGIQGGFAPVVDINSNPLNPVIHMRSFGDNPEEVYQRASAVIEGMKKGGLWTCLKHFPGHGDTEIDSHKGLPIIKKSIEELRRVELYPFKKLIEKGVDMVLIGHLLFPAVDPELPASLSKRVIQGLLREEWGFEGVVITDALNMRALIDNYPFETIILRAFQSGADLLLSAASDLKAVNFILEKGVDQAIKVLKDACDRGEIKEEEIDRKLGRIHKLMAKKIPPIPKIEPTIKKELFQHAVTCVGKPLIRLPIDGEIALVQTMEDPIFLEKLQKYAKIHCFSVSEMSLAERYSSMIVQVEKEHIPAYIPQGATVVFFDSPYLLKKLPENISIVLGYENQEEAKEALAEVLFGQVPALGKLPVQISRE